MAEVGLSQNSYASANHDKKSEQQIRRRVAEFHPNVWEYEFLQSLSSPYGAPSYCERINILIEEIKMDIFDGLVGDGEKNMNPSAYDLLERFFVVDILQSLGIERHFKKEIKAVLDYTYKYWNDEKGISLASGNLIVDLNTNALGFKVLRLNEYYVSPDVFQNFQDEMGQFIDLENFKEDESKLRSLLSLYRASEICFPEENILKQAKMFASTCLRQAIEENRELVNKSQLIIEVEYIMKYPWTCRVPRWEVWNYIKIFRGDTDASMCMKGVYEMPSDKRTKILELAILDFNILQDQHHNELKILSKWWNETKVKELNFFRQRHVEFYFLYACGLYEKELSATRLCFAKVGALITLLDDIFDTYGTIDELVPFATALIKWDMSIMNHLPEYMKTCFQFAYKTYMEIATEAEKIHGPCVQKWMHDTWKTIILAQLQDAEWIANNYLPSLTEYLESSVPSTTVPVLSLFSMLLIDTIFPDDIIEKITKFQSCVAWGCRLVDDSKDFQDEKEHGESASWIECYMKENPGTTRKQALDHANMLIESNFEELIKHRIFYEYCIPSTCKRLYFDMYRSVAFIFKDIDGFSKSSKAIRDDIKKILVEPIYF
uniref:Sesquiterpene synthase Cad n=1 Tax=Chamaecyparis formosensis TaxID=187461 RepID=CAD_CHAFM|nr:RecName: Full=Sesquiterpene synthase Cad; AltName: Full=Beta-cadinene synthase; Short=Cf-Cad [Chamaecyparis formosensis]AFJ23663.1 beta-cadinene synthase [Chamaecyparis formosensis]